MEEATKLCDEVALLNKGTIIEQGSPQSICLRHNKDKRYRVRLTDGTEKTLAHENQDIELLYQLFMGNQVETIHTCEPTLEDVFISVTGSALSA